MLSCHAAEAFRGLNRYAADKHTRDLPFVRSTFLFKAYRKYVWSPRSAAPALRRPISDTRAP